MDEDAEGFRYPKVDQATCIDCGLCEKVCPIIRVKPETPKPQRAYLLQHKDERILKESTSGGAFTAIATYVIEQGGVVFGASLNEDNEVRHIGVERAEDLGAFRNSKYVQSLVGDAYKQTLSLLKTGRMVCFSGTPCQVEGLLSFLRRPYANLLTVDVVCRAVPSPKVLRRYMEWQAKGYGARPEGLKFRDKSFYGYKYSNLSFRAGGRVYHAGIETDAYLRSFFSGVNVRPSCYACRFKKRFRVSDLTLWDCFEPQRFAPRMDNDRGVTRVLAHSPKGMDVMEAIKPSAFVVEHDPDAIVQGVKELVRSTDGNERREAFFADLDVLTPDKLFAKYFPITLKARAERALRLLMLRLGLYKTLRTMAKRVMGEVKR